MVTAAITTRLPAAGWDAPPVVTVVAQFGKLSHYRSNVELDWQVN